MIDSAFQNLVFTSLHDSLTSQFPGLAVYGDYVEVSEAFPCVTVLLDDAFPARRFITGTDSDYAIDVHFTINSYSTTKAEAQALADSVDQVMTDLRFTGTRQRPTPNYERTVYRITSEFVGRVVKVNQNGNTIFCVFGR